MSTQELDVRSISVTSSIMDGVTSQHSDFILSRKKVCSGIKLAWGMN